MTNSETKIAELHMNLAWDIHELAKLLPSNKDTLEKYNRIMNSLDELLGHALACARKSGAISEEA